MADLTNSSRSRPAAVATRQNPSETLSTLLVAALVIAALYFGREVFVPISIAVLLSFVLAPAVSLLRHWRVGRIPSVIVVVIIAFLMIFGIGTILASQVRDLVTDLPKYQATISQKIESVRGAAAETSFIERADSALRNLGAQLTGARAPSSAQTSSEPQQAAPAGGASASEPIPVEVHQPLPGSLEVLEAVITSILAPLATTGIVLIYVIFILMQREDLRDRVIRLAGSRDIQRTTAAIDDAAHRLSRYFLVQTAINATFGIIITIGLWVVGVPSPVLWGILAGLMRFVPYIGAFVAAVFPLLLAAAVDQGWSMLFETAALFLVAEPVMGQLVEPMLYGHSTGLSPIAVIVAATLWTWLWGPIGLVMATPLTVCLVVLGRHVERLQFLDVILGDAPPLTPVESFYQRMLAGHAAEATAQAERVLKTRSLSAFYDEIALPGLQMAERDLQRGILDAACQARIRDTVYELVDNLDDQADVPPAEVEKEGEPLAALAASGEAPPPEVRVAPVLSKEALAAPWSGAKPVVCVGGHTPLDEAAAAMLAQLLERHGIGTRIDAPDVLSPQAVALLPADETAMVCLSYLGADPSAADMRYTVRRLRRRLPKATIFVGFWMSESDGDRLRALCAETTADLCVTRLSEAVERVVAAAGRPDARKEDTPATESAA